MPTLPLTPEDKKRLVTLQAHAALAGYEISNATVNIETGAIVFLCRRWSLLRELDDLDQVEGWLRRAGVKVQAMSAPSNVLPLRGFVTGDETGSVTSDETPRCEGWTPAHTCQRCCAAKPPTGRAIKGIVTVRLDPEVVATVTEIARDVDHPMNEMMNQIIKGGLCNHGWRAQPIFGKLLPNAAAKRKRSMQGMPSERGRGEGSAMTHDYESIKALAKERGVPVQHLLVLAVQNDPFYVAHAGTVQGRRVVRGSIPDGPLRSRRSPSARALPPRQHRGGPT